MHANNTSGYRGVWRYKRRWIAEVKKNGERWRGRFNDPEEAARARDAKALELYGEFAQLNFPISDQR